MQIKRIQNLAIIEARLTSTRLPGKVLIKLNKDFRTIDYVISSLLKSDYFNKKNIIMASPKNRKQKKLLNYVKKKYNLKIYLGSEQNVFQRIKMCLKVNPCINLLRVTADNPLIDYLLINKFVEYFLKNEFQYLSTRSMEHSKKWRVKSDYPAGISLEMFKSILINKISNYVNKKNKQFPTYNIFSNPKRFSLKKFKLLKEYKNTKLMKLRFTLDYEKDLSFLKYVFKKFDLKPGRNNFFNLCKLFVNTKYYKLK